MKANKFCPLINGECKNNCVFNDSKTCDLKINLNAVGDLTEAITEQISTLNDTLSGMDERLQGIGNALWEN